MSETLKSFYQERKEHFYKEKEFLAEKFGQILYERIKAEATEEDKRVILFIDAGTTLLPFFKVLDNLMQKDKGSAAWLGNFMIVTNNLGGVSWLADQEELKKANGSPKQDEKTKLASKCFLLPGKFLLEYKATVGFSKDTEGFSKDMGPVFGNILLNLQADKQIENVGENVKGYMKKKNILVKTIALITGNWIRIRRFNGSIPIPLARGEGHLDVKVNMAKWADEVYVISPLGKIFSGHDEDYVTEAIKKEIEKSYEELRTKKIAGVHGHDPKRKFKLVTTCRPDEGTFILKESSENIYSYLSGKKASEETSEDASKDGSGKEIAINPNTSVPYEKDIGPGCWKIALRSSDPEGSLQSFDKLLREFKTPKTSIEDVPHLMFEFADLSADHVAQFKREFPHDYCRNKHFMKAFHVPEDLQKSILKDYKEMKKLSDAEEKD